MIAVVGTGRWGSFLTWYCSHILKESVTFVGRSENSASYRELVETRKNRYLTLPEEVQMSPNIENVLGNPEVDLVIVSIHSQDLREYLLSLDADLVRQKKWLLCMKGIEKESGKRLTEVFQEVHSNVPVGIFVGPGHVEEMVAGVPTCMVVDATDETLKLELCDRLNSTLIRVYKGTDLIGNEIGAAAKNVIGICAGYLDGMRLRQLKGALMARGCYEVGKIIKSLGGHFISTYGLAHLGDYEATLFSEHSKNRRFGEFCALQKEIDWYAEGKDTCAAIYQMTKQNEIDAPIISAAYQVLFENGNYEELMQSIFLRESKNEFIREIVSSDI